MHKHILIPKRRHGRFLKFVLIGLIIASGLTGIAAITVVPAAGAQGAEVLRNLVGARAVAILETVVYQVQDSIQQWTYHHGALPASPWTVTPVTTAEGTPITPPSQFQVPPVAVVPKVKANPLPAGVPPQASQAPSKLAKSSVWVPDPLLPLGSLSGEGQWSAYLQNQNGQTVAYRTFLQPDPQRIYAVAAIVAFDLNSTRLNFVLGAHEPRSTVAIKRTGQIPANDLHSGHLLATFNGGFKAANGHYGAMVNNITILPPQNGLGTVAFYNDGSIRIGAWGADIIPSPDLVAWRQNGPLLIHNHQVDPKIDNLSWKDWGWTVPGATAVWRSGLGISSDGRTLYYVAGPSLTLHALARTLATAGAAQAMQLDINNYWVHFDAIQTNGSNLQAIPLLDSMHDGVGRYLWGYTRDFFYITSR